MPMSWYRKKIADRLIRNYLRKSCQLARRKYDEKIVALAGDGIGPEIMEAGLAVLEAVAGQVGFDYEIEEKAFGGAGIDAAGHPLPDATLQACRQADAILLAQSVVLSMTMHGPSRTRSSSTSEGIRSLCQYPSGENFDSLKNYSPLKADRLDGVDLVMVRELTGGIYFGEHILETDQASDSNTYQVEEIERVVRSAFDLAQKDEKSHQY